MFCMNSHNAKLPIVYLLPVHFESTLKGKDCICVLGFHNHFILGTQYTAWPGVRSQCLTADE